jgi:hypothetical protein
VICQRKPPAVVAGAQTRLSASVAAPLIVEPVGADVDVVEDNAVR